MSYFEGFSAAGSGQILAAKLAMTDKLFFVNGQRATKAGGPWQ